jgi:hypothetical protein
MPLMCGCTETVHMLVCKVVKAHMSLFEHVFAFSKGIDRKIAVPHKMYCLMNAMPFYPMGFILMMKNGLLLLEHTNLFACVLCRVQTSKLTSWSHPNVDILDALMDVSTLYD